MVDKKKIAKYIATGLLVGVIVGYLVILIWYWIFLISYDSNYNGIPFMGSVIGFIFDPLGNQISERADNIAKLLFYSNFVFVISFSLVIIYLLFKDKIKFSFKKISKEDKIESLKRRLEKLENEKKTSS